MASPYPVLVPELPGRLNERLRAFAVPGSLSWRIPLGLQLLPGILLGLGTFALPASPRLLVLQGRREEALVSLAKLRLRTLSEARSDPLIQVRAFKQTKTKQSN